MILKKLSTKSLKQLKRRLDTFMYGFGVNVALDEAEKTRTYKQFILDTKKTLMSQVDEVATKYLPELMLVSKAELNNQMMEVLKRVFGDIAFEIMFQKASTNDLVYYFTWGANQGGQAALDKLRIEGIFGVTNHRWLTYLTEHAHDLSVQVDNTTKEWIAGTIRFGMENQLNDSEIASLLMTEGKIESEKRAELIVQTETARVMNATEQEAYSRMGIREKVWRTSRDDRVCPFCGPLDGVTADIDRSFSSKYGNREYTEQYPPLHPRCVVGGQSFFGANILAKFVSDYNGPVITISFGEGSDLTVTPNHLVLSGRGWIKASELEHGDYLVGTNGRLKEMLSVQPNIKTVKTSVENVLISSRMVFHTVPTPVDFHGDGVFCKNIDIVLTNGGLWPSLYSTLIKFGDDTRFVGRLVRKIFFNSFGPINKIFFGLRATTGRFVSFFRIPLVLCFGSAAHHQSISRGLISQLNLIAKQKIANDGSAESDLVRKLVDGNTGFISLNEVIRIAKDDSFHGKVYDIETEGGWYIVNDIITHNCRCYLQAVESDWWDIDNISVWMGE